MRIINTHLPGFSSKFNHTCEYNCLNRKVLCEPKGIVLWNRIHPVRAERSWYCQWTPLYIGTWMSRLHSQGSCRNDSLPFSVSWSKNSIWLESLPIPTSLWRTTVFCESIIWDPSSLSRQESQSESLGGPHCFTPASKGFSSHTALVSIQAWYSLIIPERVILVGLS